MAEDESRIRDALMRLANGSDRGEPATEPFFSEVCLTIPRWDELTRSWAATGGWAFTPDEREHVDACPVCGPLRRKSEEDNPAPNLSAQSAPPQRLPIWLSKQGVVAARMAAATAAGILLLCLSARYRAPRSEEDPFRAGPIGDAPAGEVLGSNPGELTREVRLLLPPVGHHAWVTVLELRDDALVLRTLTDRDCLEVQPQEVPRWRRTFLRDDSRPVRLLVLWSDRPCAEALAAGSRDHAIRGPTGGADERFVRELAAALARSGNKLVAYAFHDIAPLAKQKGQQE